MADWLAEYSRQYYVPLIDYERPGGGLLIASGSGIMLAVMDAVPSLRWCVDIDGMREFRRFARWAAWAENFVGYIAVTGWFSISDPAPLRQAIGALRRPPAVYTPFTDVGGAPCRTLQGFLRVLSRPRN